MYCGDLREYQVLKKSVYIPNAINLTDVVVEVPLNNLLKRTTKRIILLHEEIILQHTEMLKFKRINVEIFCSYGFDEISSLVYLFCNIKYTIKLYYRSSEGIKTRKGSWN